MATVMRATVLLVITLSALSMRIVSSTPAIAFQSFSYPSRAVVDEPRQVMFVADYGHDRIVKLNTKTGQQINEVRLVNPPLNYPVDVTVTADGESIYACDPTNHRIVHLNSSTGQLIRQFTAPINQTYTPQGVVVDELTGQIIFTDFWRGAIIVLASNGSEVNVIVSTNNATVNTTAPYYPMGITMDKYRKIYVADSLNYRIIRLDLNGTLISYFNVSIPPQEIGGPGSVALDESGGFIYYSDSGSNRVIKCSMNGTELSAISVGINTPNYLSVHGNGVLYIADGGGNRIVLVNRTGQRTGVYTPPGANLDTPTFITMDRLGQYYIADSAHNRVVQLSANGTWINTFTSANPPIAQPRGIAIDYFSNNNNNNLEVSSSTNILIADPYNKRIVKLSLLTGKFILDFTVPNIYYNKFNPQGITINDITGNIYVADDTNQGIFIFNNTGTFLHFFNQSLYLLQPNGISLDQNGNIYIADIMSLGIIKFNANGTEIDFFNKSLTPRLFAFDVVVNNNNGNMYVTDSTHNDVIILGPKGHVLGSLTTAGTNLAAMSHPVGVAIDPSTGHVVVNDQFNTRVVTFTSLSKDRLQAHEEQTVSVAVD